MQLLRICMERGCAALKKSADYADFRRFKNNKHPQIAQISQIKCNCCALARFFKPMGEGVWRREVFHPLYSPCQSESKNS
jgi:hypothetical protein